MLWRQSLRTVGNVVQSKHRICIYTLAYVQWHQFSIYLCGSKYFITIREFKPYTFQVILSPHSYFVRTSQSYWTGFLYMSFPSMQVKALGCDGSTSLASWLDCLGLHEYLPNFLSSGYRTLECVKNLWELEIINVRHHLLLFYSVGYCGAST